MLAPLRSMVGMNRSSVGFFDENKGGPLHDRRAGTDERHIDVLHLAFARTSRRLQRAFDDVPQSVYATGAEAAAEGIERQLAVELDAPVLYEIERLALLAKPVGFEAI